MIDATCPRCLATIDVSRTRDSAAPHGEHTHVELSCECWDHAFVLETTDSEAIAREVAEAVEAQIGAAHQAIEAEDDCEVRVSVLGGWTEESWGDRREIIASTTESSWSGALSLAEDYASRWPQREIVVEQLSGVLGGVDEARRKIETEDALGRGRTKLRVGRAA